MATNILNYAPEATPPSSTSPSTTIQSPVSHAPHPMPPPSPPSGGREFWEGHLRPAEIQIIVIGTPFMCNDFRGKARLREFAATVCTPPFAGGKTISACSCRCWPVQRLLFGAVSTSLVEKVSRRASNYGELLHSGILSACACSSGSVIAITAAVQISRASAYRRVFCSFACSTRCAATKTQPAMTPAALGQT